MSSGTRSSLHPPFLFPCPSNAKPNASAKPWALTALPSALAASQTAELVRDGGLFCAYAYQAQYPEDTRSNRISKEAIVLTVVVIILLVLRSLRLYNPLAISAEAACYCVKNDNSMSTASASCPNPDDSRRSFVRILCRAGLTASSSRCRRAADRVLPTTRSAQAATLPCATPLNRTIPRP